VLDYLAVLRLVADRLDAAGVPYMLTGSTAMAAYGPPRMTRDIDIVIAVDAADAARLAASFQPDFYCDADAVRRAVEQRRLFNIIHTASVIKVDLIVRKDEPFRMEEFSRRRQQVLGERAFWLTSPEDLVLSKLVWAGATGSELQLRDARSLIEAVPGLDWVYMRHWAERLAVGARLDEVQHDPR